MRERVKLAYFYEHTLKTFNYRTILNLRNHNSFQIHFIILGKDYAKEVIIKRQQFNLSLYFLPYICIQMHCCIYIRNMKRNTWLLNKYFHLNKSSAISIKGPLNLWLITLLMIATLEMRLATSQRNCFQRNELWVKYTTTNHNFSIH